MSNVNNQFKELVNEAIHNHFHDKTETEMILKDWLYGICEQLDEYEQHKVATSILVNTLKSKADEYEAKAKAYDRVTEKLYARIDHIIMTSPPEQCKPGYVDGLYNALDIINSELESGESN